MSTPYTEAEIKRLVEWARITGAIYEFEDLLHLAALVEQLQKELEVDNWFQAMYAKRPYRWNFCRDEKGDYYIGRAAIGCDPILTFATINEAAKAAKDHHDAAQAAASGEGK